MVYITIIWEVLAHELWKQRVSTQGFLKEASEICIQVLGQPQTSIFYE